MGFATEVFQKLSGSRETSSMVELVVWDVREGSAICMRTPAGQHIVVDLGFGSYGGGQTFSPLAQLKNEYGVDVLDLVIITHPHGGHLAEISRLRDFTIGRFRVPHHLTREEVWAGNDRASEDIIQEYLDRAPSVSATVPASEDVCLPGNNGGVTIDVFQPSGCSRENLNDHSLVTVVSYAGVKIVVAGDNGKASWQELLQDAGFLDAVSGAHVLVAPDHGRADGHYLPFMDAVDAKLIVIPDGRHCDRDALRRYDEIGTGWSVHRRAGGDALRKCVRTRRDGIVVVRFGWRSSGKSFLSVHID